MSELDLELNPMTLRTRLVAALAPHFTRERDAELAADSVAEFLLQRNTLRLMHIAIENTLIELRDSGLGVIGSANGFVVKEKDGSFSKIIRLGTQAGLRVALEFFRKVK